MHHVLSVRTGRTPSPNTVDVTDPRQTVWRNGVTDTEQQEEDVGKMKVCQDGGAAPSIGRLHLEPTYTSVPLPIFPSFCGGTLLTGQQSLLISSAHYQ
ncbi:unnamed protein product [Arctogadus glacialis]